MKWLWGDTWKSEGVSYQLGRQGASDERSRRRKEEKRSLTITEETPPPSITRNLTPMSNLLESLLKVMQ